MCVMTITVSDSLDDTVEAGIRLYGRITRGESLSDGVYHDVSKIQYYGWSKASDYLDERGPVYGVAPSYQFGNEPEEIEAVQEAAEARGVDPLQVILAMRLAMSAVKQARELLADLRDLFHGDED